MHSASALIEPSVSPHVEHHFTAPNSVPFRAACFGGRDWSLRHLQNTGDSIKHLAFSQKLADALRSIGATCAFAPNPTKFNGKIISPVELTKFIALINGVYLRRNQDAPADGTLLRHPSEAGIFSAGGCGVVVVTFRQQLVFAHAGRECLLDRAWVESEGKVRSRAHHSVIDSMLMTLGVRKSEMHLVHAWPLYFIRPDGFIHRANDEKHGKYNKAAIRFLPGKFGKACGYADPDAIELDLAGIARSQLISHGVPPANVHRGHEYLSDELPTTRKGDGRSRYLVAITRLS